MLHKGQCDWPMLEGCFPPQQRSVGFTRKDGVSKTDGSLPAIPNFILEITLAIHPGYSSEAYQGATQRYSRLIHQVSAPFISGEALCGASYFRLIVTWIRANQKLWHAVKWNWVLHPISNQSACGELHLDAFESVQITIQKPRHL